MKLNKKVIIAKKLLLDFLRSNDNIQILHPSFNFSINDCLDKNCFGCFWDKQIEQYCGCDYKLPHKILAHDNCCQRCGGNHPDEWHQDEEFNPTKKVKKISKKVK